MPNSLKNTNLRLHFTKIMLDNYINLQSRQNGRQDETGVSRIFQLKKKKLNILSKNNNAVHTRIQNFKVVMKFAKFKELLKTFTIL